MDLRKVLIKNTDGKPCVVTTAFVLGFAIVNLKLILSGFTIKEVTLSAFTGGEYAAALGALGAIYVMRRGQHSKLKEGNSEESS